MEILNVENLKFSYPNCDVPVLDSVSFNVNEGEFVVLCGATGSGKSTLLKVLKPEIMPLGKRSGHIKLFGEDVPFGEGDRKSKFAGRMGYVCQNPKEQAVTDKVWHELAFGLENMNMPLEEMRIKVAEMASYFGIEGWFEKKIVELSGGQLQLLNLASVMVMNPDILILDEPSAQLDPIASTEFFNTLRKLNDDFSLTIIVAEHHLEELIPCCDRMIVLKKGKVELNGKPCEIIDELSVDDEIFEALPSAYRLYRKIGRTIGKNTDVPITIKDGRDFLRKNFAGKDSIIFKEENDFNKRSSRQSGKGSTPALEMKNVSFRYSKDSQDALKEISLSVNDGEIFCLLGGNGSGKTTALNVAAGLLKPYEGTVRVFGKKIKEYKSQSLYNKCLAMLPQDVQTIFLHNTVREEMEKRKAVRPFIEFDVNLLDKHPYDLSGGEQQMLALEIVLATEPRLILLDEPTKGLDAYRKKKLALTLKKLKEQGITLIIVTHDIEFAAECADKCAMLFRGSITAMGETADFLSQNNFYTTSVCRMTKGICQGAVTVDKFMEKLTIF